MSVPIDLHPTCNKYTKLSLTGRVQEYWEKDENGVWQDKTAIAKAEEAIKLAEAEIKRTNKQLAKDAKEAKDAEKRNTV